MDINWNNIRPHQNSKNAGFEELCSQLFRNERPQGAVAFERRGYRDAGLECAHLLRDGTLHGMQAKYFTQALDDDQWEQVDKSVRTALTKNCALTKLSICIPQNFDDPKIANQTSAMDKWRSRVKKWDGEAMSLGRTVEFALWNDTELSERLTRIENKGKRQYFFSEAEFTPEWFLQRIQEVAEDAKPHYTEELNVQLPIAQLFEGLGRTEEFARKPNVLRVKLDKYVSYLSNVTHPPEVAETTARVLERGSQLSSVLASAGWRETTELPLAQIGTMAARLLDLCYEGRRILDDLAEQEVSAARSRGDKLDQNALYTLRSKYNGTQHNLWEIAGTASNLADFSSSDRAQLANQPALLVVGRAGTGKTHLFVDVAKQRAEAGLPTVVLLGANFHSDDPLDQVIKLLGLTLDHETFLQTLEAAAEASGGRVLILIDALNEAAGRELWQRRLAGFITRLLRHPRIGIALSVRTTYESVVIPEAVGDKVIRVEHHGFAAKPEQAARAFFAHYKIALPQVPLLNPEFTNPLFLKVLCKGLHDAGKHELPEGFDGITQVFAYLIEQTHQKLVAANVLTSPPHDNVIRRYLDRLSDALVDRAEDAIPVDDAFKISQKVYPSNGYLGSLLALGLTEGILSKELIPGTEGQPGTEGISFAYQRLQDHEVGRRLLDLYVDSSNPAAAFKSEGPIGKLLGFDQTGYWRYRGLVEALAIQVPERYGVELVELFDLPIERDEDEDFPVRMWREFLGDCLLESLLWRRKEAISDGTFKALQSIATNQHFDRYVEILLTLAAVPQHPMNADRLDGILWNLECAERDAWWTRWIARHADEDSALDRLIAWALLPDNKSHLSDEAIHLTCVALLWLTVSTVRNVRDRATKGLVRLLTPRSHLIAGLLERFTNANDQFLTERLYAAAYGVVLRAQHCDAVGLVAEVVYSQLFAKKPVLPHILVRDYGRLVIDRAVRLGCALSFDSAEAWPPYGSALPADPPTKAEFEALYPRPAGEWSDLDRAVNHVVNRFGEFDHSKYWGGPSLMQSPFSTHPLTTPLLKSRKRQIREWEQGLEAEQIAQWEEVKRLRNSSANILLQGLSEKQLEELEAKLAELIGNEVAETSSSAKESNPVAQDSTEAKDLLVDTPDEAFERAVAQLDNMLNEDQRNTLHVVVLEDPAPAVETVTRIPQELLASWVSQGALDLGWTRERFAASDGWIMRLHDGGGHAPSEDTIGTKYLWISYYNLLARLADNYYLIGDWGQEGRPYEGAWDLRLRTIDPCIVPSAEDQDITKTQAKWWMPNLYVIDELREGHAEWLRRGDDLPNLSSLLLVTDPKGVEWVALESYPKYEQQKFTLDAAEGPRRNLWFQIRGYLIKNSGAEAFCKWMKQQDFTGRWMPEGGDLDGLYLGELYNSHAWDCYAKDDDWEYQDWHVPNREEQAPSSIAPVKAHYSQSVDDRSAPDPIRLMVPSPLLVREAGLRWNGEPGEWTTGEELVVKDPDIRSGWTGTLLVRRDFLDDFLQTQGYTLVWAVVGEKLVYNWDERYPRLEISGSCHYSKTGVECKMQSRYSGRDEVGGSDQEGATYT